MSYSKLQKEIEKRLKVERELAYNDARDAIFREWIEAKRYKELVSCAHGGWFSESEFFEPLAIHFVKERKLDYLKFLCERKIRFLIEDTLSILRLLKEDQPDYTLDDILAVDIEAYKQQKIYDCISEVAKYRLRVLERLEAYIVLIEQLEKGEYLHNLHILSRKVYNLEMKKKDLLFIKNKM